MNIKKFGATKRRTLSLPFGGKHKLHELQSKNPSSTIPDYELRRIVAAMVD